VGLQEYYQEDLKALSQVLGWSDYPVFEHNATGEKYEVSRVELEEIMWHNQADYALYRRVVEIRNQRLKQ